MPLLPSALYRAVMRPVLFSLDAEAAHHLALSTLALIPPILTAGDPPELRSKRWGMEFANPIGLAAGMDKDARAVHGWQTMGFGFVELGTITPRPQPGNPKPRIFRLPEHGAVINRLGFPSDGMDTVAERIRRIRRTGVRIRLGLNFGPNKETPPERVAADYAALTERLGALADFIVINVSSPNTPGLRNWQSPERMRELFPDGSARRAPTLIKIAPDLDEPTVYSICDAAIDLRLDGIVVCNTTLKRAEAGVTSDYEGGLSGKPLLPIARKLIASIYRHTGGRLPIVGVGGIVSAEDALGHIKAGASLVELYTGLIYQGPGLVAEIKAELFNLLQREGFRSINDAIGSESRSS